MQGAPPLTSWHLFATERMGMPEWEWDANFGNRGWVLVLLGPWSLTVSFLPRAQSEVDDAKGVPIDIHIHSHAENFSDGGGAAGGELRKVGW